MVSVKIRLTKKILTFAENLAFHSLALYMMVGSDVKLVLMAKLFFNNKIYAVLFITFSVVISIDAGILLLHLRIRLFAFKSKY